jgi:hypothetical protein
MKIMDPSGHTTREWDTTDSESIATMETEFDRLMEQGYLAFEISPSRENDKLIHKFNPDANIILSPKVGGGAY